MTTRLYPSHDGLGPVREAHEPELAAAAQELLRAGEVDLAAVGEEDAHARLALDPVAAVRGDAGVAVEDGGLEGGRVVVGAAGLEAAVAERHGFDAGQLKAHGARGVDYLPHTAAVDGRAAAREARRLAVLRLHDELARRVHIAPEAVYLDGREALGEGQGVLEIARAAFEAVERGAVDAQEALAAGLK